MRESTRRFTITARGGVPRQISDHIRAWLFMHRGREVEVTLRQGPRSTSANRYYWGVVLATIRRALVDAGQPVSAEELHEAFKRRYLDPRPTATSTLPPSTAGLDAFEFYRYVESIRHDEGVLALGIYIPDPDESGVEGHTIIEVQRERDPTTNERRTT